MLWLTYSWEDNKDGDVDYLVSHLQASGFPVSIDRFTLSAGRHIWDQISDAISDPCRCSAWAIYSTKASFLSPACHEEYQIALTRALAARGSNFPIFGLFPETYDSALLPVPLRSRLAVSLSDPEWVERVKAAAEGRGLNIGPAPVDRFHVRVHPSKNGGSIIEIRVRAGRLFPITIGVPEGQRDRIQCWPGPSNYPEHAAIVSMTEAHGDGMDMTILNHPVTPTDSAYIWLKDMPTFIKIGEVTSRDDKNGHVQWDFTLQPDQMFLSR
ncbi:hypothetical protein D3C72_1396640 [compost metagenome]